MMPDEALMLDEGMEAPPIVRFDERRMHIRAYNYWASLLGDRTLPSIEDLNPAEIHDFGSHSVLLDFTSGIDDPSIAFLGTALAAQCDVTTPIARASQIPPRTLLSRLTDHYLQIIANAAPIGFEAEFTNQRDSEIMYRGIMMPFSTDDDTIDFVYGVINWKEVVSDTFADSIAAEVAASGPAPLPAPTTVPVWADRPSALDLDFGEEEDEDDAQDGIGEAFELTSDMIAQPDEETMLGDSLALAREAAAAAHASEGRTRAALYRAIGLAHAFACVAAARPADYTELLTDSGIAVQERSPLTALAKLVFGHNYDKTRLTEFVCAIQYALDADMAPGALTDHLLALPGGLKGLVASVRAAKRGETPAPPPKKNARVLRKLGRAAPIENALLPVDENGLAVVVVRQEGDGSLAIVGALPQDDRVIGRVYASAAKQL
ncbi:PAS domain-containing protein [Sphingobium nicotianae]|nr:hypothetical protein [Sphingobium nicotianae]